MRLNDSKIWDLHHQSVSFTSFYQHRHVAEPRASTTLVGSASVTISVTMALCALRFLIILALMQAQRTMDADW